MQGRAQPRPGRGGACGCERGEGRKCARARGEAHQPRAGAAPVFDHGFDRRLQRTAALSRASVAWRALLHSSSPCAQVFLCIDFHVVPSDSVSEVARVHLARVTISTLPYAPALGASRQRSSEGRLTSRGRLCSSALRLGWACVRAGRRDPEPRAVALGRVGRCGRPRAGALGTVALLLTLLCGCLLGAARGHGSAAPGLPGSRSWRFGAAVLAARGHRSPHLTCQGVGPDV